MKTKILGMVLTMGLVACGGGGGGASSSPSSVSPPQNAGGPSQPVTPPPSTSAADLSLAARLYKGDERTPSGFDVEYGWGGALVEPSTWIAGSYDAPSVWGHRPSETPLPPGILRPFTPARAKP